MKIETKIKLLVTSLLFILNSWNSHPPENTNKQSFKTLPDPCLTVNNAFQAGEELTYKVFYNWNFIWLSAGEVTFKVLEEGDQFHFKVVGETYNSYNWFFEVKDYFDSWVQKENLLPVISTKTIKEGKYRLYDHLTFNQAENKIFNERGKAKDDIRERHDFNVQTCMHDMVSVLYYSRNIDYHRYDPGDTFPMELFADKKTWPIHLTYNGKESDKKIKGKGKYNTLKFSPKVFESELFPEDAQVNVWVSDDANKIPLIIESPLSVGSAKAVLKSYNGLRYGLDAKVDK